MNSLVFSCLILPIVGQTATVGDEKGYHQKNLLVEAQSLRENPETWVILDVRPKSAFDSGHIPGALWIDHASWDKAFSGGKDANNWSKRIRDLGILRESKIVLYDDNLTRDAARIWWILRFWGIRDAGLLNGGWKAWLREKYPLETTGRKATPSNFEAIAVPDRLATKDQLLESLKSGTLQIVDARSQKEFCGEEKLKNKRAGAIPGAKNLEWDDLLDPKTGRFLPAVKIHMLLEGAEISLDRPTATHCQSGGRASVMAFALELMGAREVRNYYSSWAEWGNDPNTPIVPGTPNKQK